MHIKIKNYMMSFPYHVTTMNFYKILLCHERKTVFHCLSVPCCWRDTFLRYGFNSVYLIAPTSNLTKFSVKFQNTIPEMWPDTNYGTCFTQK
jgi:hypothetical protein